MATRTTSPIGSTALITLERWILTQEKKGLDDQLIEKVRHQLVRRLIEFSDVLEHSFWTLDLTEKQLRALKKGKRPLMLDALDYLTAHANSPTFSYEIVKNTLCCYSKGAQVRGTWT